MIEALLPPELKKFAGRILDVDSHEMLPAQRWVEGFGPEVQEVLDAVMSEGVTYREDINHANVPDFTADDLPVDASIWQQKGSKSPGATDAARRLEVMDAMGVSRQLMFPTFGLMAVNLSILPAKNYFGFMKGIKEDRYEYGRTLITQYNEWAIRAAKVSDRIRPVLPVIADSVSDLMEKAKYLIDNGIHAIYLPSSVLPGGKSPASNDLDPFWELLAENKVIVCLHVGGEGQFFETLEWGNARAFENYRAAIEFRIDPWWLSVTYWPSQNFTATMILGGVFERHPDLVLGVMETTGSWVGPMIENLDNWAPQLERFKKPGAISLPNLPSFYLRRNVRVAPFDFEPIGSYIDRCPMLADVFCFGTDYPHVEGGKNPTQQMYDSIKHLGPDVVEKFFVTNGEILFPS